MFGVAEVLQVHGNGDEDQDRRELHASNAGVSSVAGLYIFISCVLYLARAWIALACSHIVQAGTVTLGCIHRPTPAHGPVALMLGKRPFNIYLYPQSYNPESVGWKSPIYHLKPHIYEACNSSTI